MKYYKSQDNQIYALEDDAPESFLPEGCEAIPEDEALAIANPPPTTEQLIPQYIGAVRARLDDFARTRGYENITSACSYAVSNVARYADEGKRCVKLRDITWMKFYEIISAVKKGEMELPTLEEVMARLPALSWTDPTSS